MFRYIGFLRMICAWMISTVRMVIMMYRYQLLILVVLLMTAVVLFSALHGIGLADTDPWPLKHHGLY